MEDPEPDSQAEPEAAERTVRLHVQRGDAASGTRLVTYQVPVQEGMVVLDAVLWVQSHLEGDLAVRWNCKAAKCGSCSAEINGFPQLMCKTRLSQYPEGDVTVRPMHTFPLVRDLVTDVSWNYEVNRRIPPFTPSAAALASPEPWRMAQEDVDRVIEFRKCIECFLCQDVCHVLRNHDREDAFFGPRFMIRMATLEMHPKDVLDRTPMLRGEAGAGMCNITKCCTEVCPEHIHITDNAIIPLKERMDDIYFDPVRAVGRLFAGRRTRKPEETPTRGKRPIREG
ncbi:MAG: succinate dehydrogenase/fumarate reductase iron-sulfur subunit [Candidatus Dormibacteraceae bacterium]